MSHQYPRTARQQPQTAADRRGRKLARLVIIGFIAAGALVFGLAEAFSGSGSPPTPYQACVTSIGQEAPGTVLGYTPACMKLSVAQRNAAIAQYDSQG